MRTIDKSINTLELALKTATGAKATVHVTRLNQAVQAIRQLMEERDRYREALGRIASAEDHYEPCGWAIFTAKQALG